MTTDSEGTASLRPMVGIALSGSEAYPEGLDALAGAADLRVFRSGDEIATAAAELQVVFVWQFRFNVLRPRWAELANLEWVHTASAGVDAVVFPELVDLGVVVTNSRGILDDSIAEWVLGVMIMFVKDLPTTIALQRAGAWQHRETGRLAGSRVLVIGAGSIGRAIARLSRAAGMVVEGIARTARPRDADFDRVDSPAGLDRRLAGADFVVISAPLTAETRGMIGAAELAAMKPGARLVNVGRGPIVDEAALVESLRAGHLAGAALDVFEREPLAAGHPFWSMEQVIVSPHMSGDFVGWRRAFTDLFVDNFRRRQRGEPLRNVVDVAAAVAALG